MGILRHAKDRAKERYGVDFTYDDLIEIREIARTKWCSSKWRGRDMRIEYQGSIYRIQYDPKKNRLLTFLPLRQRFG